MNPPDTIVSALTAIFSQIVPEMILGAAACVLFLGGTWKQGRCFWGTAALLALAAAAVALVWGAGPAYPTAAAATTALSVSPLVFDSLTLLVRIVALAGAAVLVLTSWDEVPEEHAADHHACLLILTAGVTLTAAANELVTLFLALELISIPTYVILYLVRSGAPAQEAALKYFLLSIFSSAFLLFGFSYLYGLTGTTNLPAIREALATGRDGGMTGLALVALVMVVAALGFRITAVPFHFYAPDVYEGTATSTAALLSFVPKVAGFAALLRVIGFAPLVLRPVQGEAAVSSQLLLAEQVPVLLWIMAAVTMTLGNVFGLLQDNVKRLLAYSGIANAGYMLIGLAVAPRLAASAGVPIGGVEAVLFYLVAYGAMTIGAFAILTHLSTPVRQVETVDDLAGLARSHPGSALLMVLFLFSLIGMPLTAGFAGKLLLFFSALSVPPPGPDLIQVLPADEVARLSDQVRLFRILAVIGALNAAVAAWYYLRIAAVMFLREPLQPIDRPRVRPVLAAICVCAFFTLLFGVWQQPLLRAVQLAAPHGSENRVSAPRPAPALVDGRALPDK